MPACGSKFVLIIYPPLGGILSEETEEPQWPRAYSLGRLRFHGCMSILVGDSGQVLGVLGWALTRMRNLPLVLQCCRQDISTVAVCGAEL